MENLENLAENDFWERKTEPLKTFCNFEKPKIDLENHFSVSIDGEWITSKLTTFKNGYIEPDFEIF